MRLSTVLSELQSLFQRRSRPKQFASVSRIVVSVFPPKLKSAFGTSFIVWSVKDRRRTRNRRASDYRLCVKLSSNMAGMSISIRKRDEDRSSVSLCPDSNADHGRLIVPRHVSAPQMHRL